MGTSFTIKIRTKYEASYKIFQIQQLIVLSVKNVTMKIAVKRIYRLLLPFFSILFFVLSYPKAGISLTTATPDSLSGNKMRLLHGEVLVTLTDLQDGVTGVEGQIFIAAPPKQVWDVITDYDHHKNFVPNVIDSGLISDNGIEKVMFEKGKSGILFFKKTVNIKMRVWGEVQKHLYFEQITGDFKVYHGEWILVDYPQGQGTFLTYRAEVKPSFFSPRFAVKNVQKHDCPSMLSAMKKEAESILLSQLKKE